MALLSSFTSLVSWLEKSLIIKEIRERCRAFNEIVLHVA